MKTSELLINARAKVDTPEKWIRGCYAKNKDGGRTNPTFPNAVKFCMHGAVIAAAGENSCFSATGALHIAIRTLFSHGADLYAFNDSEKTTHEQVMAVFDLAIKNALEKNQ